MTLLEQNVGQFVTYDSLPDEPYGLDEIRRYLASKNQLRFVTNQELEEVCDLEIVEELSANLINEDIKENVVVNNF
ncbi:hypothetical protein HG263_10290 [Pseudoalteromonas sp. JBTF-M23]|uniref:Uncharacterized protein n=1 Tax=Pseudoalteromonas caenipelagi TaxID=2726988 RepID=A0A849VBB5_9GAMM|nr:hypothetical protein [Pseudoalteromonas caenipelagi]NOU50919.1 hypothetical protein [Pseudoalteromonas caenipelagi]